MKRFQTNFCLLFISLLVFMNSFSKDNPFLGFSGGIGISSISNSFFQNPFEKNQLAYSFNSRIKMQVKRDNNHQKTWLFYSNSIKFFQQPSSELSNWITPNLVSKQNNLMIEHQLGFIVRRWLLFEIGTFKELGGTIHGFSTGGGIIFPLKNHSIEFKANYCFNSTFQQKVFVPSIIFNFDPKQ
jgi:hypothetical protein